jgi:tRNA threonylcarbamoyladenosine biosynthesis protein TsaB
MTKLLALDTSTDVCSVALIDDFGIKEKISETPRAHTQLLLPMVKSLLEENQTPLSSLDAIAFGCGPGSFTGLRICLSTAQGLAFGADLPLIPVSSLSAMVAGALRLKDIEVDMVVPMIDARMDEIYWSIYDPSSQELNHSTLSLFEEQVSSPQVAYEQLLTNNPASILGVGSGWKYSVFQGLNNITVDTNLSPLAYDIVTLGLESFNNGAVLDPLNTEPTYLRNEISWQKRQRIRQQ